MKSNPPTVVVSAFTEEQVQRLTGISGKQLRYWDRTGFYAPAFAYDDRGEAYSRLYSFKDLVSLRVLNALRNEANVSLPHLREVKEKLAHLGDDLWSSTTLYVLKKKVIFDNPETRAREEIVSGQGILGIPLSVVTDDMHKAVDRLHQRRDDQLGQVTAHRNIVNNQPVVAGTRIPVRSIKAFADAGYTVERILDEYPTLTADDVRAALEHKAA